MTGTTSAGSFRTLQRSPSRRGSAELVYPALSPQVYICSSMSLKTWFVNNAYVDKCGKIYVLIQSLCVAELLVKVMEVIRALEEHKKKAENEGNYMEARAAAQRLNGVKVFCHRTHATRRLPCLRCNCTVLQSPGTLS